MPFHLYKAWNVGEEPQWFGVRVEFDEDRWVASCNEANAEGEEQRGSAAVAPKFYGVTADQAHRRMREALETTYEEVVPAR